LYHYRKPRLGRQVTDYDLFSPTFKADPFPTYAAMRARDPVYAHLAPDGRTIWYVTRYEDVAAVLKDDQRFCKNPMNAQAAGGLPSNKGGAHTRPHQLINQNMLFSDPPDHTRLRALVSQAFTPRRVAAVAERIRETAGRLIERMAADGHNDLIAAYALPLPVIVISDMLGIPDADREAVADWSQAIISPGSRGLNYSARKRKVRQFMDYLRGLFALRQADPRDDLITALVQAETDGQGLSEAELFSMVALLLVTGHETTVNLVGNGALALLRAPDQLEGLRADARLWPAAVEELLRFDGPVETSTSRWARADTEFGGRFMRRGDLMRPVIASANRDAAQFEQPDVLDIGRTDNRHLAFGLGAHYCLGAPLARLEGSIALETLFSKLPDVRLAIPPADLAWRSGVLFRGLRWLPINHS
jgi:cytochrome P450